MNSRHSFIRSVTPTIDWKFPVFFRRGPAHNAPYQQVKTEEDLHLNLGRNEQQPLRRTPALLAICQRIFARCNPRVILSAAGLFACLLLVIGFLPPGRQNPPPSVDLVDQKLHLFVPTSNDPDIGYCRTQLTAAILGYPTPFFVNREYSGRSYTDQQRDKIRISRDYLNLLTRRQPDNLVILLDSPHSWFQLRPEVLMQRYYDIIGRADRRLQKQTGRKQLPTQTIVFGAQDHCSQSTPDKLACFAPPSNPTDKSSTLRFPDDGIAIGPFKDMLRLFQRMHAKTILRDGQEISQQGLLADLFGEQEFRREYMQHSSLFSRKRKLDSVLNALGWTGTDITEAIPEGKLLEDPENAQYELGITLDYDNELGLSVPSRSDREGVEWIRHDPKFQESPSLPQDIARSMPPYWTMTSASLPIDRNWSDVPLLTSKRTGSIPAVINVGGEEGFTSEGGLDWRDLWLHAHAQNLWEAQKEVPRLPLTSAMDSKGVEHTFWNEDLRVARDGANWAGGIWKPFTDFCGWTDDGQVRLSID